MLARSAEALFTNLIDYAGLFPPASLSIEDAVRKYDEYSRGELAWMLGRFVVPPAQAHEVPPSFRLSVLGNIDGADVIEVKAANEDEVAAIAEATKDKSAVYVEVTNLDLIDALAKHRLRAKIRTGGVTRDAFPDAARVVAFMRRCADAGVAFKATAGLHHPLRCVKPLTYAADAPTGTMHGFVNVFMAAALLPFADDVMIESDPKSFVFADDAASWRGHAIATDDIARIRRDFAISFGSCSFEEPVADLEELGWL